MSGELTVRQRTALGPRVTPKTPNQTKPNQSWSRRAERAGTRENVYSKEHRTFVQIKFDAFIIKKAAAAPRPFVPIITFPLLEYSSRVISMVMIISLAA